MLIATFFSNDFNYAFGEWQQNLVATLEYDTTTGMVVLHGPRASEVPMQRALVDPDGGEVIRFEDEPESWLRLIGTHYATPDLRVEVKQHRASIEHIDGVQVLDEDGHEAEINC